MYDFLAEFSCINKLGIETTELRFSAREPTVDSAKIQAMIETAISVGIDENIVVNMT